MRRFVIGAPTVATAPVVATAPMHHGKKLHGKASHVAVAPKSHAGAFLAKHDAKNKHKRDEIDKLLGL